MLYIDDIVGGMEEQGKVMAQNGINSSDLGKINSSKEASVFKSILKLKEEQRGLQTRLSEVEKSLDECLSYKHDLVHLNEELKTWALKIQSANRNNQGVPYVRDIKEICNKILGEMQKPDFKKIYGETLTLEVPCFKTIHDGINNLEKLCSKVLQNEANYKATWVEEMRQLIGRLIGASNAILDLYFEG